MPPESDRPSPPPQPVTETPTDQPTAESVADGHPAPLDMDAIRDALTAREQQANADRFRQMGW